MSETTSGRLYDAWRDAAQKFDYFVTGIAAAVVGFLAKSFEGARIGINPGTLELVSLLLLVGAVASGLLRIETTMHLLRINLNRLEASERAAGYRRAAESQEEVKFLQTGERLSPDELSAATEAEVEKHRLSSEKLDSLQEKSLRWYRLRNAFLLGGILALLAARVWSAYR